MCAKISLGNQQSMTTGLFEYTENMLSKIHTFFRFMRINVYTSNILLQIIQIIHVTIGDLV